MLRVSAFSICLSPEVLPAQADTSLFYYLEEFTPYPRDSQTQAHPWHTQQLWDDTGAHQHPHVWLQQRAQHCTHTPEALSSSWLLQPLQHVCMWHKGWDRQGKDLRNHPLTRHMKRGQLGSSGAGLTRQEYWLTPFYTQLAPFAFLSVYLYLFLLAPPSCAHSLNTRYNPTISSSLSNSQATQVCIFISCEVTVCLEPISYLDRPGVIINSWLVG